MAEKEMCKESIRKHVRERYGMIANKNMAAKGTKGGTLASSCCAPAASCCESEAVSCGSEKGLEGQSREIAEVMGYSTEDLDKLPEGANMGLGCGNPVAMASLKEGQTVLDLGSGGGMDCFLAAEKVGKTGQVIGVDMTPDMVSKARSNAEMLGTENVEFRLGEIEHLPVADGSVDVILSNCVINLSPEKEAVFQEAYRVLKTGGRLAISDILTTCELPGEARKDLELISACIGGAATVDDTKQMLEEAGFEDVTISAQDTNKDLLEKWVPGLTATEAVISARIEAIKPG
jgi:arsenite methyltransferase